MDDLCLVENQPLRPRRPMKSSSATFTRIRDVTTCRGWPKMSSSRDAEFLRCPQRVGLSRQRRRSSVRGSSREVAGAAGRVTQPGHTASAGYAQHIPVPRAY